MTGRTIAPLVVSASLAMLMLATPVVAHPGGHGVSVGTTLHVWTEPGTGRAVPGSLMFVVDGAVHVEDAAGRVHTWPMAALSAEDQALASAFRARIERLNGVRGIRPDPMPRTQPTAVPAPIMWWLASALLAILCVRLVRRQALRMPILTAVALLPIACGGSSSVTAPSTSAATTTTTTTTTTPATSPATSATFPLSTYFTAFPTHVRTRQDSSYFYVESDGMADHVLMVGIRSWQQQVPLPQPYTGTNAYAIPLVARLAAQPVSARTALFNGAIAVAVNGVPIFNALNNRGDDAYLFGELDDFGGHSGRADDYHYHTAPFQLSATVGATRPIAVALDGFPLYGALEPDGSALRALDDYNGHTDTSSVYHYHGTKTYPYINGGMKGVVSVVDDHVDPQPTLKPVRPAGTPLAGATITAWSSTGTNAWRLEYKINSATYRVDYRVTGSTYTFVFTDPSGATRTETYTR